MRYCLHKISKTFENISNNSAVFWRGKRLIIKTCAVFYLIFSLFITQTIQSLHKHHLEHQHRVYGAATRIALALLCLQLLFKNGAEHLEINNTRDKFQWITLFGQGFERLGTLKQITIGLIATIIWAFLHF